MRQTYCVTLKHTPSNRTCLDCERVHPHFCIQKYYINTFKPIKFTVFFHDRVDQTANVVEGSEQKQ